MLDIEPGQSDDEGLLAIVDRLGTAGSDRAAARAHEQVRRAVSAGVPLPGLRFLATNLAAVGAGTLPPPPRHPADEPGSLVAAVRDNPLLILDDVDAAEVAAAVAALVDDGRRVIVTASDSKALAAVRGMLPPAVIDRVVDVLPALAPADLHRLRGLLATSTPARRARAGQQLPDLGACPAVAEVAQLCATAVRTGAPGVELIADVLRELDAERRAAVTAIAQCVQRALTVLGARTEPWVWDLLGDLVHGRRRSEFDRLVQSTAQALATIDDGRGDPPVRATGPLPEGSVDALVAYLDFLENGGRARSYFRATVQREVEPVLRVLRVGDHEPATSDELRIVLTHFELGERVVAVDGDCATLGLPTPQNPDELTALSRALTDIGAAARSVAALRHDVLFLHPGSPVSVPDVAAAEQLAAAVLDYGEFGSQRQAAERLDAMAADLAALLPPQATAPEHARAVDALRAHDPVGYAEAIDELVGAHLARRDEQRTADLLTGLGSDSLARAWTPTDDGPPVRAGLAWFTPTERLLVTLPPPDRADVVVVVDAAGVGVDRALLGAAAPRLLAVAAPGARAGGTTLLSLLYRASALVIRGRSTGKPGGRVVPLTAGARSVPVPRGQVEQAGA
jgi:hypothetical protein